jgi:hypothetical protein
MPWQGKGGICATELAAGIVKENIGHILKFIVSPGFRQASRSGAWAIDWCFLVCCRLRNQCSALMSWAAKEQAEGMYAGKNRGGGQKNPVKCRVKAEELQTNAMQGDHFLTSGRPLLLAQRKFPRGWRNW